LWGAHDKKYAYYRRAVSISGLYHYVDKQDALTLTSNVVGDSQSYKLAVEQMFTHHEYPDAKGDSYVVSYDLCGNSFERPVVTVSAVCPPVGSHWDMWRPSVDRSLLDRINSGAVPGAKKVRERYENDIKPNLQHGHAPTTPDDWETVLLNYYYTADRVLFLLNLHTVVERADLDLAYDASDVEHASKEFRSVAVIPTAVDLLDYNLNEAGDDCGLLEQAMEKLAPSGIRDETLLDRFKENLTAGMSAQTLNLLNYVDSDEAIDFFGVAVPDAGSPQEETRRLTPDSEGSFEVQGFSTVVKWLER
jgi:hypothetical protein